MTALWFWDESHDPDDPFDLPWVRLQSWSGGHGGYSYEPRAAIDNLIRMMRE